MEAMADFFRRTDAARRVRPVTLGRNR